ncbi:hypothetical protein EVAR_49034_1 [Eumeta japonica]|uniref:Uncharacterized protein n=1 Tax=Eumeta variegata TaxID=151549 RepID=A0A4C1XRP6_EUMVA|nr:hypothetical protein EVAR_49034_1 [Eumeta japonica]
MHADAPQTDFSPKVWNNLVRDRPGNTHHVSKPRGVMRVHNINLNKQSGRARVNRRGGPAPSGRGGEGGCSDVFARSIYDAVAFAASRPPSWLYPAHRVRVSPAQTTRVTREGERLEVAPGRVLTLLRASCSFNYKMAAAKCHP